MPRALFPVVFALHCYIDDGNTSSKFCSDIQILLYLILLGRKAPRCLLQRDNTTTIPTTCFGPPNFTHPAMHAILIHVQFLVSASIFKNKVIPGRLRPSASESQDSWKQIQPGSPELYSKHNEGKSSFDSIFAGLTIIRRNRSRKS